eukprot:jgi/Psemu1/13039/gm1.13039_g
MPTTIAATTIRIATKPIAQTLTLNTANLNSSSSSSSSSSMNYCQNRGVDIGDNRNSGNCITPWSHSQFYRIMNVAENGDTNIMNVAENGDTNILLKKTLIHNPPGKFLWFVKILASFLAPQLAWNHFHQANSAYIRKPTAGYPPKSTFCKAIDACYIASGPSLSSLLI